MDKILEENYFVFNNDQINKESDTQAKKYSHIQTQTDIDIIEILETGPFEYISIQPESQIVKSSNFTQTEIDTNIKTTEKETQTEIQTQTNIEVPNEEIIKKLRLDLENSKNYNQKLLNENMKLLKNFNEMVTLVNTIIKIDSSNPNIEEIKSKLAVLVNREIRLHMAFPFVSFLSRYSK